MEHVDGQRRVAATKAVRGEAVKGRTFVRFLTRSAYSRDCGYLGRDATG